MLAEESLSCICFFEYGSVKSGPGECRSFGSAGSLYNMSVVATVLNKSKRDSASDSEFCVMHSPFLVK
jgi:hypothetical protein